MIDNSTNMYMYIAYVHIWSYPPLELRLEMNVRFVNIGVIVDHHCLNFLFISNNLYFCNIPQ